LEDVKLQNANLQYIGLYATDNY